MRIVGQTARRVLLAAGLMAAAVPGSAETLADTLVAAYNNSNLLEQNRALLRATDEDVAVSVSALRPVINFITSANYTGSQMGRSVDELTGNLGLTADLLIYDFGRTQLGVQAARETVLATREALVGLEQQVLLTGVQAFFNVRSAVEFVALGESNVRLLEEELRASQDRFSVGEVTRTDVALSEARLAAARADLAAARGDLDVAREAYKVATGRFPGTLTGPTPMPRLADTLAEARALAARNHPSVKQAQRQVTVAGLNKARAAAATRGTLSAGARLSVNEEFDDSSSLSLSFSQPIYQGGRLSALFRQALAREEASRAALLQAVRIVENEVGRAWSNFEVGRIRISAAGQQIEAARIAFAGAREEATLGARTTLDVLDAEQELLNAQATRIAAVNAESIAAYTLLASMGLLTVEQLNLGIPTYDPEAYYNAVQNAPATSVQGERLDRVMRALGREPAN